MKTGDVIAWVVVDNITRKMIAQYPSRSAARAAASRLGGRIAKVVVAK